MTQTFEEQFPLLKKEKDELRKLPKEDFITLLTLYTREEIQRCCLDKNRVRDAIEKLRKEELAKWHDASSAEFAVKFIEEELGI